MSRLQQAIEAEERGEPVDYAKLLRLQVLDVARIGEVFVEETIERERQADERIKRHLAGN